MTASTGWPRRTDLSTKDSKLVLIFFVLFCGFSNELFADFHRYIFGDYTMLLTWSFSGDSNMNQ